MTKVFINGESGTTGLRLRDRLAARDDVELIRLPYESRRDEGAVAEAMARSDIVFLCLPDDAARTAAEKAGQLGVRVIDASTAHRVSPGWVYGFPELSQERRKAVANALRVAVPGCHASGFAALVYPLVKAGILKAGYPLHCTSLTGYSGGGKSMIAEYESPGRDKDLAAPRMYALSQSHKHLAEMREICALSDYPTFTPVIGDFYSGMLVSVPLRTSELEGRPGLAEIHSLFERHYGGGGLVRVMGPGFDGILNASAMSGYDDMRVYITGGDERVTLCALFDNLGKGASGAAVQCFNLMTDAPEAEGLNLTE